MAIFSYQFDRVTSQLSEKEYAAAKATAWISLVIETMRVVKWHEPTKEGTRVDTAMMKDQSEYDSEVKKVEAFIEEVNRTYDLELKIMREDSDKKEESTDRLFNFDTAKAHMKEGKLVAAHDSRFDYFKSEEGVIYGYTGIDDTWNPISENDRDLLVNEEFHVVYDPSIEDEPLGDVD